MNYSELLEKIKKDLAEFDGNLLALSKAYSMVPQQVSYIILKGQIEPDAEAKTKYKERIMSYGRN